MKLALDICGWIGMIMVVTGFYLVSNGKIEAQTNSFQIINIVVEVNIVLTRMGKGILFEHRIQRRQHRVNDFGAHEALEGKHAIFIQTRSTVSYQRSAGIAFEVMQRIFFKIQ